MKTTTMASKAPPPTRLTEKNMKRSREMLALITALPPSKEKDAILLSDQYGEWEYHVNECHVKKYTHKPTQEEKVAGETVNEKGETVKDPYFHISFLLNEKCILPSSIDSAEGV